MILNDLKFATRTLTKEPAFTFMVVAMLAIGVAGTSVMFSVFNALFLRPLPFPDGHRLVDLDETAPQWDLEYTGIAYPDFDAWREHQDTFGALAAFGADSVNLSLRGEARRVDAAQVTHDMAAVLRIEPVLGRHFTAEEDRPNAPKVAMLGYDLWQSQFGADPGVLGEAVLLDSEAHTVIGILPPSAVFVGNSDLWVPLALDVEKNPDSWYLNGLGRLRPGVTMEQARVDLTRIHKGQIEQRAVNEITSPVVMPVLERYLGRFRLGTSALFGAVGVVLLIVCANIAGLMLARSAARSREVGIRVALGAGRRRIVRQLLTESLMLAVAGGLLGAGLGALALRALLATIPEEVPRWIRFDLDGRFLIFSLLVVVGAAVTFGLGPALQAARTDVRQALAAASQRSSAGSGKRRGLDLLVVAEVALAVTLLVGAGLTLQGFRTLTAVEPGFQIEKVLTYRVSLPEAQYAENEQRLAFFEQHLEAVRALPGVVEAAAASSVPLGGHWGQFFEVEGAPPLAPDEKNPVVLNRVVTPGYFQAAGVTLLRGRTLEEGDGRTEGSRAVVVNEAFVERFLPTVDPIGQRVRYPGEDNPWMTIVGVARDVRHYGLDGEIRPGIYQPFAQLPVAGMAVIVRSALEPMALVASLREAVRAADPEIPPYDLATMGQKLEESLWPRRAAAWMLLTFATLALGLAVAGIYGVVSYAVSQRGHEISIRMALGARRAQVLRQVLRSGMSRVLLGVAVGLGGGFLAARLLAATLFGVRPSEPTVYLGVTLILVTVAVLANLIPAQRAATIDPMDALRSE